MKNKLFWRALPIQLVVVVLLLLPFWQQHAAVSNAIDVGKQAQARLVASRPLPEQPQIDGKPVRVVLPRLGIDVAVVEGVYDQTKQSWSVASLSGNYAPTTAKANNARDTTLIYGHWSPRVFGPTKDLAISDVLYVYTDNGHLFQYSYSGKDTLKATDTQIFDQLTGEPGLALLTCEGSWAQNRRIMFFSLVAAT